MSQQFRAYKKDSKYGLVIVTGGSTGIGNSIIELLGKLEPEALVFNLSRRKPPSFTIDPKRRHLECDLSDRKQRSKVFETLERELRQPDSQGGILLVNNAGFGLYGPAANDSAADHLALLEVNVCALVELTARLLPMIKHRGGSIMNIASTAAFQPTPYTATYGASKAFVLNWTLALNQELKGSPAHAIAVCPGPTRTEFFKRAGFRGKEGPAGFSHGPDQVAAQAIKALYRKRAFTVTGFFNKLLTTASSCLPLSLRAMVSGKVIRSARSDSKQR